MQAEKVHAWWKTNRDPKTWGCYTSVMSPAEIAPRIVADQNIRFGRPVIAGTRVPVELIIGKMAGGMGASEVAEEYGITHEDVLAALSYAAQAIADEQVRAIAK
jgi:uncharacterized protein (DUF433 family)